MQCVNVGFTMGRSAALKSKALCQRRLLTLRDLCVRYVNNQPVNVNFDNESLKFVDKFCYLGDTISAGGGADAATIARTRVRLG